MRARVFGWGIAAAIMVPHSFADSFVDSVGFDAAFSWVNRPKSFICPTSYSNDTFRYVADEIRKTGVRHVRDRLYWHEVAPSRFEWRPQYYLDNALMLRARGIGDSGLFSGAPLWAGVDPSLPRKAGYPRNLAATYEFCRNLAATFGDCMEVWEFWNEQDSGGMREGAWEYAGVMKAAYLGFKAGGFRGIVAHGALCREDRNAFDQTMYGNDIAKYSHVMNFHTYMPPVTYPRIFRELRQFLGNYGVGDRAILLTECGTNQEGHGKTDGVFPGLKMHSPQQERIQEEFAVKSQILTRMEGVRRTYLFVFGAFNEAEGRKDWGLMRRDGTLKPAVAAITQLVAEVGEGEMLGEIKTMGSAQVRAFAFVMPDGSRKAVAWRRSEIDDGVDEIREWSDEPVSGVLCLKGNRQQVVETGRLPKYVRLESEPIIFRSALAAGKVGELSCGDEDKTVVFRADLDRNVARLGGNNSLVEMDGKSLHLNLEVWNLDGHEKSGFILFNGEGEVHGLPSEKVIVPPMGRWACGLNYEIGDSRRPCISFSGVFNGKRTTRFIIPVFSEREYIRTCDSVDLDVKNVMRWRCRSSASTGKCAWDDSEGAMRFEFEWLPDNDKGRWFFPAYSLDIPREMLAKTKMISFEVRSVQDKVENDYNSSRIYLKGSNRDMQFMCAPPTKGWESRRVLLTDAARGMDVNRLEFGGHPRGRKVLYWIRRIRLYNEKNVAK